MEPPKVYLSIPSCPLKNLSYNNNLDLCFDSIPLSTIAKKYGTPLYIYSQSSIETNFSLLKKAFPGKTVPTICYAVKANSNLSILKILGDLGCGFDIVSEGELLRVIAAGCNPEKVIFSGVGKSRNDIEFALKSNILCFNVESESELIRINEIAISLNKIAPISIRVNPDVDPQTHEYISTSLRYNKFGVSVSVAFEMYKTAKLLPGVKIKGIDCHLGSQIFKKEAYIEALIKIIDLVDILSIEDIKIEHLDIGGGFGVSYFQNDEKELDLKDLASEIEKMVESRNLKLILEPGRFLVANAGIFLTKVEYIKKTECKNFAIIDGAMNDLIRPALYSAFHKIIEAHYKPEINERIFDVVGPICESGDFLGKDRVLKIEEGDFLAVLSCGAYGMVMSSNYNSRARVAEILVTIDQKDRVIKKREDIKAIFELEKEFL